MVKDFAGIYIPPQREQAVQIVSESRRYLSAQAGQVASCSAVHRASRSWDCQPGYLML